MSKHLTWWRAQWKATAKRYRMMHAQACQAVEELRHGGIGVLSTALPVLKAACRVKNKRANVEDILAAYDNLPDEWRELVSGMVDEEDDDPEEEDDDG